MKTGLGVEFNHFMNSPVDEKGISAFPIRNPLKMERSILEKANQIFEQCLAGNGLQSLNKKELFFDDLTDGGTIVYFPVIQKFEGNKMQALVGSPLYIALYLKRYEEAQRLLERFPYTAEAGYAAMSVTVCQTPGDHLKNAFSMDYGAETIYLEDREFLDKEMPDHLFLKLCGCLAQRQKTGSADLPIRNRNAEALPMLVREFPCSTNMPHADKAVQEDEKLFWKMLDGFLRLRNLDESLFCSLVDGQVAAHLLVRYARLIDQITQHTEKSMDLQTKMNKLRRIMKKLGFAEMPAEKLWSACEQCLIGTDRRISIYRTVFMLWKHVFQKELSIQLEGSFFQFVFLDQFDLEETKALLSVFDRVEWKTMGSVEEREECLKCRHAAEEVVLATGDAKLLADCVHKNVFPLEDMEYLLDRIYVKDRNLMPFLVMQLHGYSV